jgi:hypothetical protein
MLSIEYDVAIPDLVAFNEFHWRRTPAVRRRLRTMQFAAPAVWLVLAAVSRTIGTGSFYKLWLPAGLLACAVVWPLWFSWNHRRSLRKCVAKLIGAGQGMVGRHSITLEEEALVERTEGSETRTRWSALGEVCEDERYVCLCVHERTRRPRHPSRRVRERSHVQTVRGRAGAAPRRGERRVGCGNSLILVRGRPGCRDVHRHPRPPLLARAGRGAVQRTDTPTRLARPTPTGSYRVPPFRDETNLGSSRLACDRG